MSAYVIKGPPWSTVGTHVFKCSLCNASIPAFKTEDELKFCWHCGVKFGPEPKAEPTAGEWWYDRSVFTKYGRVYTKDALGRNELIASVAEMGEFRETNANGYLLAASKKLLEACKQAMRTGIPNITSGGMVSDAIAAAEGKK